MRKWKEVAPGRATQWLKTKYLSTLPVVTPVPVKARSQALLILLCFKLF